jgi:hypothetical protein
MINTRGVRLIAFPILAALAVIGLALSLVRPVAADTSNVGKLRIMEYGSNAPGKDTTSNRNAEFVRLVNVSGAAVDVTGWILHDSYRTAGGDWGNRYTFRVDDLPTGSPFRSAEGRFVVPAGGQVYVYNGSGADTTPTNTTAAIYRDFKHVYNNGGDSLYLRDADGQIVTWVQYTPYRVKLG